MFDENEIAERIRLRRKDLGMTQGQLAARVGVSLPTITRVENGMAFSVAFGTMMRILNEVGYDLYIDAGVSPRPAAEDVADDRDYVMSRFFFGGRANDGEGGGAPSG